MSPQALPLRSRYAFYPFRISLCLSGHRMLPPPLLMRAHFCSNKIHGSEWTFNITKFLQISLWAKCKSRKSCKSAWLCAAKLRK
eukprot:6188031-Pleurochrysis_carterae.AAC.1